MSELQRVDRLTEPVVKGQFYLVPTVFGAWGLPESKAWPVIGPMHTDAEFFDFKILHWHIDTRFVAQRYHPRAQITPLSGPWGQDNLPPPVWKRRKCRHAFVPAWVPPHPVDYIPQPIIDIREHFAGQQCASGKGGWICPHRKASLGSILPVDGVITCPLHGLQIDAASGKVLDGREHNDMPHSAPVIAQERERGPRLGESA